MRFVDEVTIEVRGGDGGDGSAAMRREKHRPLGGPAGGDGGDGGDVVFKADGRLTTLLDLAHRRRLRAGNGQNGRGKDRYGKGGERLLVRVPVGTLVYDVQGEQPLADLSASGQSFTAARGGKGGRGNIHFASPTNRAPAIAEDGQPGQQRRLRLELKLLADVGVVGFPNVGKSTLVSAVSRARPKVADYPFTTLVPHLGLVRRGDFHSFVIADIPGIVGGASAGAGLGLRFLRHIERTRVLLFLVSYDPAPGRSLVSDFAKLGEELKRFDEELARRPGLLAVSKLDLPEVRESLPGFRSRMERRGVEVRAFSAATGQGVGELLDALERLLDENPPPQAAVDKARPSAADRPHGPPAGGE